MVNAMTEKQPVYDYSGETELIMQWWNLSHLIRSYRTHALSGFINEYLRYGQLITHNAPLKFTCEVYRIEYAVLLDAICDRLVPHDLRLECLSKILKLDKTDNTDSGNCSSAAIRQLSEELDAVIGQYPPQ